jgi:hypothetical protein
VERYFKTQLAAPGGCKTGARGYQFGCLQGEQRIRHHLSSAAFADDLTALTDVTSTVWSKIELAVVLDPLLELGITHITQNFSAASDTSWTRPQCRWEMTG